MNRSISPVYFFSCVIFSLLLTSCQSIKQSSKYRFTEGWYTSKALGKKPSRLYVVPTDDSIKVYKGIDREKTDSIKGLYLSFKPTLHKIIPVYTFKQNTFDIDILTILFKYRPTVKNFPNQFVNAVPNGELYLGYRTDNYKIRYTTTPLHVAARTVTHYGLSAGVFTGFGTARVDEYVTQSNIAIEYDGFVNLTGISCMLAVNKISFGITGGIDHLLDKNNHVWIYQGTPWVGISLGLNLN